MSTFQTIDSNGGNAEYPDRLLLVARLDVGRPGVEEDAPSLVAGEPYVRLIAVFDGLGGAGSRAVEGEHGTQTSAYYASRIAREAVREAFKEGRIDTLRGEVVMADEFARVIGDALARRNATAPAHAGAVRSSLIRSYPTTAAVILFDPRLDRVETTALWAGDSRCYALTPLVGLQQLSCDDSRAGFDPMAALSEDSPMSNVLTADGPCRLHGNRRQIDLPAILIAATDGSFGCLPSPMHFELMLLEALAVSHEVDDWQNAMHEQLQPIANDDISVAVAFIGWPSLRDAAIAFATRLNALRALLDPFHGESRLLHNLEEQILQHRQFAKETLAAAWESYRKTYMALLPNPKDLP